MAMLQISVDKDLLRLLSIQASAEGKSLEAWAVEVLAKQAGGDKHWVDQFLDIADNARGNSDGRKWTRDELYDR